MAAVGLQHSCSDDGRLQQRGLGSPSEEDNSKARHKAVVGQGFHPFDQLACTPTRLWLGDEGSK